jgi:YHS domain-containing protein
MSSHIRETIRSMSRPTVLAALLCLSAAPLIEPAFADKPPIYTPALSNLAVGGYDSVAYFNQGKAVKGEKVFSTTWNGAQFQFATQANRDAFVKDPTRYAPQYGGYCAWAAAQGRTASGDPTIWKIVNDKLYLNYNAEVQKKWEADIPGLILKADKNWPQLLK